jgi:hypothetical protein
MSPFGGDKVSPFGVPLGSEGEGGHRPPGSLGRQELARGRERGGFLSQQSDQLTPPPPSPQLGVRSELDFLCVMLHDFLSLGADSTTYYARLSPAAAQLPPPRRPVGAPTAGVGAVSIADPHGESAAAQAGSGGGGGGGGGERGAFLARVTTAKMFDAAGRVWQVRVAARPGPAGSAQPVRRDAGVLFPHSAAGAVAPAPSESGSQPPGPAGHLL